MNNCGDDGNGADSYDEEREDPDSDSDGGISTLMLFTMHGPTRAMQRGGAQHDALSGLAARGTEVEM